jgi:alpha-galactosidase
MKIKLAVIGGGSVNWMRGLMRDVYCLKNVEGGEIRLVDPNVSHVTSVKNMLLKFNECSEKDFDVSVVEDRKDAMRDCDFVLTTFSPGAMCSVRSSSTRCVPKDLERCLISITLTQPPFQ